MADSKDRTSMRREHRYIITRHHMTLVEELDPDHILDKLFSEFIIDLEDMSMIKAKRESEGRHQSVRKLMEILRFSGFNVLPKFVMCLRFCGYSALARLLDPNNQQPQEDMEGAH